MYKKVLFGIAILLCCLALLSPSFAKTDVYLSLQIDNPMMTVNGEETEVDAGRGTAPLIIDGRTLLPVRAVIEAFGGAVTWDSETSSVLLTVGEDSAILRINSNVAYINGEEYMLDVTPCIVNERTMLPIRFIAECFGFGIAWDGENRKVYVIKDVFTKEEYERFYNLLPDYSGEAYAVINENVPFFEDYELIGVPFEYYSPLDSLGRCGLTLASLDEDMMPTEERKSISSVSPSGWINKAYDFVPGGYIYNRCHLIGYQLTGENANERNLITGTRYLNIEGMLDFENAVADYVRNSESRVMYRVTPVFLEDNMVAHGVLIEAAIIDAVVKEFEASGDVLPEYGAPQEIYKELTEFPEQDEGNVEAAEVTETTEIAVDTELVEVQEENEGEKVFSVCVFCYNVQPGIMIDYKTGESRCAEKGEDIYSLGTFEKGKDVTDEAAEDAPLIYRTPAGERYHFDAECGGNNSYECTWEDAIEAGLTPCGKCAKEKSSDELMSDDF